MTNYLVDPQTLVFNATAHIAGFREMVAKEQYQQLVQFPNRLLIFLFRHFFQDFIAVIDFVFDLHPESFGFVWKAIFKR